MMTLRSASLFGLFLLVTFVECRYRSDYKYYEELNGWLKYHRMPDNFTAAFMRCHAEGATLAYPNGDSLQQAMLELKKESCETCGIFTGIHSLFSQGDYLAFEGLPLNKMTVTWAPDEPSYETDDERCTVMLENGNLAAALCTDPLPYICYRNKTSAGYFGRCGTVAKHYTLDTRTGSCYKFHQVGRTWIQAYRMCLAEGGYLAIINNALEASIMKELFAEHPSDTIDADLKDVASVGFYDMGQRNWFTTHGQYLSDVYSAFGTNQPDQLVQRCGGMFRSSLLDDVYCDYSRMPFICEKNPDSL